MSEPLIAQETREMYSCWFMGGLSISRSQTLRGLQHKAPSQWSARGSVWNRAAWWWVACESHSVPRRTFAPDFTSPSRLRRLPTLWWPPGGQHVFISCQTLKTWAPFFKRVIVTSHLDLYVCGTCTGFLRCYVCARICSCTLMHF